MAIARGAGTDILRTMHMEDVDDDVSTIIIGEPHHIYTVLSVIVYAQAVQAAGNYCRMYLYGWDANGATANQELIIFKQEMQLDQTFVWNDKFSFTGHDPTGVSSSLSTVAEQNALADQGGSNAQKLQIHGEHADDNFDVHITYIDQNNA